MKTVEFVVVFSLCIHFAYSSSISHVYNEAAAEDTADTKGKLLVLSAADSSDFAAAEDPVGTVDNLMVPLGGEPLDAVDGAEPRAARSCTANACRELCRRLGFLWWRCSGNWCICSR
ncbi:hypothetical protein ABMA27_015802 [Loxostege sticticalis]|uniref:Defensin n=1 Tax=Loxostege sticticalis TaxID=481309 RepID=A0ABR3I4D6_LOXSC